MMNFPVRRFPPGLTERVNFMTDILPSGLGSKAVALRFAPFLSARLHALYDPIVLDALPAEWRGMVAAAAPPTSTVTLSGADGDGVVGDVGSSLRVLLVEDDGFIRLTCAASLRRLGHLVHEVASGEEALAIFDDWMIDVLIADVNLPGLSGVELARRAAERAPAIRIIFATGLRAKDFEGPLQARALRMAKPYGELELRRALGEVILL